MIVVVPRARRCGVIDRAIRHTGGKRQRRFSARLGVAHTHDSAG
jgi:hypothetical protein